jgi:undecaprenyl-diphosphatase
VNRLADFLGHQASPWAYVLVGLLAALEASAFVGLFIPGELALLTGGYLAQRHDAALVPMLVVAAVGAVVGDSIGYEVGRHFGPRLQRSRLGQRVGEERWDKADDFLRRHGGPAIFLGRFVGLLRALVPAVAGSSQMRYRRFLVWNALGGLIWAPGMVLLGYAAGSSYKRIEHYAGQASILILGIAVVVGAIVLGARWVSHHRDQLHGYLDRQAARPPVAAVRRRYRRQLDFLFARLDRGSAVGLALTVTLLVLIAAAWAFGSLLTDVVSNHDVRGPDHATLDFMVSHRTAWLTDVMKVVTHLGSGLVLIPTSIVVAAIWLWRCRTWLGPLLLAAAYIGTGISYNLVKRFTHRDRPPVHLALVHAGGYAFPSGHAAQSAAVWGAVAFLAATTLTRWPQQVAAWTAALLVSAAVGVTRLYLGVHWLSDVLAGWALGSFWLAAVLSVLRLAASNSSRSRAFGR